MPVDLDSWIDELASSRKYHGIHLPRETLCDLLEQELPRHRSPKEAIRAVREKLHHIVAPYLGDPDYAAAAIDLENAFQSGNPVEIQSACAVLLNQHASMRERLPHLVEFYRAIFDVTGKPGVILDLACGIHPLGFPWMGLPHTVRYHAWDLHQPRVALLNRFFRLQGLEELAFHGDILVNPPQTPADVAFFFKEAHRFEQRRRGCNREFWQAIRTRWLVITLPARSLTGHRLLADQHRRLVLETIRGLSWSLTELEVGGEMIFCLQKPSLA